MSTEPTVFSYGSLEYGSATKSYVLELSVNEESFSIPENTSQVSYVLKLISGGQNRFSMFRIGAEVWLGGSRVGFRDRSTTEQISLGYNSSVTLLSDTVKVYHSPDGTYTMPVAFSIDMENDPYTPGPISVSGLSMPLTTIPRKSSIRATDADIGAASAVAVTKQAESFTHSIAYSFGELSGYIKKDGSVSDAETVFAETAVSFRLPDSFYQQIPNAATGVCTLTVNTYSGATLVGTDTCSFTATAARYAVHPLATADMTDINETTLALTGDNKTMIRYCSTARCEMYVTTRGYATQTHAAIGDMYKPLETDKNGYTVLDMPAFQAEEVYFYTIDSRGYDYGIYMRPTVIPYTKLTERILPKWVNVVTGEAKLQISGTCFSGSFGAADNTLHIQYRVAGQETYIDVEDITVSNDWYEVDIPLTGLDYRQEYNYEIRIWDALMQIEKSVILPKGQPVFHWGAEDFRFCVPVGMNDNTLKQVHSVNGLSCGGISFAEDTVAYLPVQDRSLILFGLVGNGGEYALYLVMLDSPGTISRSIRLSGTLNVDFTLAQEGVLQVTSPTIQAYGWYIKNSDHADLITN